MSALCVPMTAPTAPRVYWSRSFSAIMRAMVHALGTGERATVITGECGAGKTTLLRVFREQIQSHSTAIHLDSCRTDAGGLLPWLLHAMGVPSVRHMTPDAALHAVAARIRARGKATALLIDEAQTLRGSELAQLAALLTRSSESGLSLFLFGQPGLAVSLRGEGGKALTALPHRRHVLRPLDRADVEGYVRFRSSACGRSRVTFTDEAIDLVCLASRGSPRLTDRLCDSAFEICRRENVDAADAELVREAIRLGNEFDVFASDTAPIHASAAPVASSWNGQALAAPCPVPSVRPPVPPTAAMPTARHAPRSGPSRPEAAKPPSAETSRDHRRERPKPGIRFLRETPPGSAISSAELIVYEDPRPSCCGGGPKLGSPKRSSGTISPAIREMRPASLSESDTLIRDRLLGLSWICVLLGATGLFLQPLLQIQHTSLVTPVAPGEQAESTDVAPRAAPLAASRPDGDRGSVLEDLLETLPWWRRTSEPDEAVKPRVFSPSRRKRPPELDEVIELWRPYEVPDR